MPKGNGYPEDVVMDFVEDYEENWCVRIPFDDAVLIMSLYDGLHMLLEKYAGDDECQATHCLAKRMIRE